MDIQGNMKIFAISDLHLSGAEPKPMNIFGSNWENHWDKISCAWRKKIDKDDIVLIAGDISWAMQWENAMVDLNSIAVLPGQKIMIKGNHEYWWNSVSKLRAFLPSGMYAVQNDAVAVSEYVFCGTRGWLNPVGGNATAEDRKIYSRELMRLEMSLKAAQKLCAQGQKMIGMTHFPPLETDCKPTPVTELFEAYGVQTVVFGHVHGMQCSGDYRPLQLHGVRYYLTSCDYLGFSPVCLL